jgi:hypothetical protein
MVLAPWAKPSDELIDEYARTSNEMMALVRPPPGAAELLAELRGRGWPSACSPTAHPLISE